MAVKKPAKSTITKAFSWDSAVEKSGLSEDKFYKTIVKLGWYDEDEDDYSSDAIDDGYVTKSGKFTQKAIDKLLKGGNASKKAKVVEDDDDEEEEKPSKSKKASKGEPTLSDIMNTLTSLAEMISDLSEKFGKFEDSINTPEDDDSDEDEDLDDEDSEDEDEEESEEDEDEEEESDDEEDSDDDDESDDEDEEESEEDEDDEEEDEEDEDEDDDDDDSPNPFKKF